MGGKGGDSFLLTKKREIGPIRLPPLTDTAMAIHQETP